MTNMLLVLIWFQTVFKGYQQTYNKNRSYKQLNSLVNISPYGTSVLIKTLSIYPLSFKSVNHILVSMLQGHVTSTHSINTAH